jgi:DNA (cytosine-5)-methyltransferase 1
MTFTAASLFCGIGGFCFGFERVGIKTIWANDIEQEAIDVYRRNFPETKAICADIRDLNKSDEMPGLVDVLHAGFPCQSFSQAGNRKGFDDDRGQLFHELMVFIRRMGRNQPKVLVFENSPFLALGDAGEWFDTVRREIQRAGYWFDAKNAVVLDTRKNGGLPQRRDRLFMVATSRAWFDYNRFCGPIPKKRTKSLESLLELGKVKDEYYYLSEGNKYGAWISTEAKKHSDVRLFQLRKVVLRPQLPGMCPTLTANMGQGGHNVPFLMDNGRLRKLTEKECLRLQGFPGKFRWSEISHSAKYRLIGNSVSPIVTEIIGEHVRTMLQEDLNEDRLEISA